MIADRYEILGTLGRGGMGEVYLARDHRLATEVALKRVPPELAVEPTIREALVREARILARLSDNHIVRLFDLADTADGMFLVLEYVCGPSLDKVLARRTLQPEELQHVMDHVAEGLKRAHSMGVIHRDLKPSNLLVQLDGDERRRYLRDGELPPTLLNADIKVTDFGLAKVVRQASVEMSQGISGTPAYMAPEQFRGEIPSAETDIYALGFVAYACLTGGVPMRGADPAFFHLQVTPPPIVSAPPHMDAAIQRAIRKERADRFHVVTDFALALRQPPPARPIPAPVPAPVPAPEQDETQSRSWLGWRYRRWNRKAAMPATLVVMVMVMMIGLLLASRFAAGPRKAAVDSPPVIVDAPGIAQEPPPLAPINPAQRIDALPPVIEGARMRSTPAPLPRGVSKPETLARFRVTGARIQAFGPDGTLYVSSDGSDIGAIRDGRLVWQYKLAGDGGHLSISTDGLIWVRSHQGVEKLYCFNSAGQGGEITNPAVVEKRTMELIREGRLIPEPECADAGGGKAEPAIEMPLNPTKLRWRTAVDYGCDRHPVVGRDGAVAVQTRSHTEYLLASDGRVLWTYIAPCDFFDQRLLGNGTAVGLCSSSNQLLGIRDGRQVFSIASEHGLSIPFAEDAGNDFYRFENAPVYDEKRLIRTNSDGKDVWNIGLKLKLTAEAAMGPDGNIYVLSTSPGGAMATIVGDRHQ
ncbi:protein kinase [uncultured Paludibaculum sp.]|uniref:serine/threonine-protein kinase n=1 Tax=uncultured Paludibaculum sp. TaxID=1765020 RepID=UPI002AAB564C|nr:protein kinase [uncultured Paludibaculum sp.]